MNKDTARICKIVMLLPEAKDKSIREMIIRLADDIEDDNLWNNNTWLKILTGGNPDSEYLLAFAIENLKEEIVEALQE